MRQRKGDVFMQADIEQILSLIAGSYNTAFHRYRIGESTEEAAEETGKEESFDGGIRRWENPEYRDQRMIQELFDTLEKSQLTLYFDRFGCRYLLFPVDREEERALLSIGPYLAEPSTREGASALQKALGWDNAAGGSLFEYRNTLPVLLDEQSFILMIRRIAAPLAGEKVLPFQERQEQERSESAAFLPSRSERYEQSMAAEMIRARYRKENDLLDAMLTGDDEKAAAVQRELARFRLPGRFSSLRGAQNIAIIFNTLCRKNLERASVHPAFIDQISRGFTERINSCVNEKEVVSLQREMIRSYCSVVRQCAAGNVSPLLRSVMDQALLSLDGEVSLHALAEKAGVGESYLSARFREETGKTFSSWLREKRVARAKDLLVRKELSIAQVAEQIGMLDVSYFIRVFKKETGVTPGEWRKAHKYGM